MALARRLFPLRDWQSSACSDVRDRPKHCDSNSAGWRSRCKRRGRAAFYSCGQIVVGSATAGTTRSGRRARAQQDHPHSWTDDLARSRKMIKTRRNLRSTSRATQHPPGHATRRRVQPASKSSGHFLPRNRLIRMAGGHGWLREDGRRGGDVQRGCDGGTACGMGSAPDPALQRAHDPPGPARPGPSRPQRRRRAGLGWTAGPPGRPPARELRDFLHGRRPRPPRRVPMRRPRRE